MIPGCKLFIFLTISFSLSLVGFGQQFSKAKAIEKNTLPESFRFSAFGYEFLVDANSGKAKRTSGARKIDFRVPLRKQEFIEKFYFSESDNDLFLLYVVNEGGYVSSTLLRLDGKTNKLEWRADVAGINPVGILDGDRGYFAGVGFIAGVDLATGKFVWKHENLYIKKYGKISIFAVPVIESGKVIFQKSESDPYAGKNKLVVEKITGKFLSIE